MIKKFLKDLFAYLPAQLVPGIVGFISIPIITRIFSPSDYGQYSLALCTISILITLLGWLPISAIRFYAVYEINNDLTEFYENVVSLALASLVIVSGVFYVAMLLSKNTISQVLYDLLFIGVVVFILESLFNTFQYILRAKRQALAYSVFSIWYNVGSFAVALFLIFYFHRGIQGLLVSKVVCLLLALPFVFNKAMDRWYVRLKVSLVTARTLAVYSFPLVLGNLAAWILSLSDRYVLQIFRGAYDVGIYSASYNIADRTMMFFTNLFMFASGPISMTIWEKEGAEKSKEFMTKTTRYFLLLGIPMAIGLSILSKSLITVLAGEKFFDGYRIISIVIVGAFFLGLQRCFQSGLLYHKKTGFITVAIGAAGLLNLVLNIIFIPRYGYIAAAITTLISYIALLVLMIILSRRFFIWDFPMRSLLNAIYSALMMGACIYIVDAAIPKFHSAISLIVNFFIGAIVYFVMLFLLCEYSKKENELLLRILKLSLISSGE